MVIKLDGKYKKIEYTINRNALSVLIFTPKGIMKKDYPDLMKIENYEKRLQKIRDKVYYEIDKFLKNG